MTRCGQSGAAFTLIELLLILAIMALLLAVLMPALGQARAQAESAACQSNLRQWCIALQMYMNEHDDVIPRRGQGIQELSRIDRPEDWFNVLPPQVGEPAYVDAVAAGRRVGDDRRSIFCCPSARDPGSANYLPYAMNMYLSPWIRPRPHVLSEFTRPETVVFMADAPGPYASTVPSMLVYSVLARHMGRANLSFLDGHVESRSGTELGCGVGDPNLPDVRWQPGTTGVNQGPVQ
ncbi:MAG: hypothetical protein BIFFINMI_03992 [Phycisphaerae bacterium]|nr:hypothetical protein [Phycisphaerae bacterium]